jgi:hypothetical protein
VNEKIQQRLMHAPYISCKRTNEEALKTGSLYNLFFLLGFLSDPVPGNLPARGTSQQSSGFARCLVTDATHIPEIALETTGAFDQPLLTTCPDGSEGTPWKNELKQAS